MSLPDLYERKRVWFEVPQDKKLSVVRRIGERISGADRRVARAMVSLICEDDVILVANSAGLLVEDIRPMTSCMASCVIKKNGRKEKNFYSVSSRQGLSFYTDEMQDKIASETVSRTAMLLDAVQPPAGEMPVVLAPGRSGILLHEAMGHSFEADFIRKKTSIFSSSMGKKVAEDFITIVDSGLAPLAGGSIHIDDEGSVARKTVLGQNGKLVSYLHDRISARHFRVDFTGNGRRESFRFAPIPRMRVTYMENGPHDPEDHPFG